LDNVVDSMPSILLSIDAQSQVTQWNSEAEKTVGISRKKALGQPLASLMPHFDNLLGEIGDTVGRNKRFFRQRLELVLGDHQGLFDIAAYPLLANGNRGAVIRIDDVTERARLEEVMVQTEKMMTVGGLAAGMAHEINNPLAGIMQSVQVIQNRFLPELPKNTEAAEHCNLSMESLDCYVTARQIDTMLSSVMASGERASRIINNMLSFSRKSVSLYTPCDINALLDKTVELAVNDYDLKKRFDFKRIEIVRDYDRALPKVRGDSNTLQQVFFNLLKNGAQAMKNTKKGQDIGIEADGARITLRTYVSGGYCKIEVEDNGIGMDEKTTKRIFEPFFTTKEVGMGTGLGLSVSFFIIKENHNGTIDVSSRPGKGAIFTIGLRL
ncbi:MAG TPA: ATP-binding protein, partial [Desulfopila sp.]|nr:ATP-binding protein [Desulfopila sp.]